MNKLLSLLLFSSLVIVIPLSAQYPFNPQVNPAGKGKVNLKVDNMGYWKMMVRKGYVKATPEMKVPEALKGTSIIRGEGIRSQDSPDVPTTPDAGITQSENSVFVRPDDEEVLLNSNNSATWTGSTTLELFGADGLYSEDGGLSWGGSTTGAGGTNMGDPAAAIDLNGIYYLGKINSAFGQSVAHSNNQGNTWNDVVVATVPSPGNDLLDKNHLWVDNSVTSPYQGSLYDAWTKFLNGGEVGQIEISRSTDQGETWSAPTMISTAVNAISHNQGVNLQTGPSGQVYAAWAIYDAFPADETAIGFARSFNGGAVFMPATRILNNIRGIRSTGTAKNMRVNSFPSMTVDISGGNNDGAIYIVWANIGFPGVNDGPDIDVYLIRSFDQGTTWSAPVKVNQDAFGSGKNRFFPWITCDPDNGNLAVVYYDDRNTTSAQCETYISYSYDAGDSWTDLKVSDVAFTPLPISGLAMGYFGDYLGISSKNRKVYPVWTDNRSGSAMSYVSPVDLGPPANQPFLVYDSYSLTVIGDTANIPTMNFGDSLFLSLGLKNIGDQPVSGVTAAISSLSPYITITDSLQDYGDFAAGELKVMPHGYSFKVSDTIPDGQRVKCRVRIMSPDTTWYSSFSLTAHAPDLRIAGLTILDTAGNGNHNKRLDPGETVKISFRIVNDGDFTCEAAYTKLHTTSPDISLLQDSVFVGDILPGGTVNAVYDVQVSEDAAFGSWADLIVNAFSGKYRRNQTFIETIGVVAEDWETGDFTKFPWTFAGNSTWKMTTVNPFEGVYSAKSGIIFEEQSSILKIDYTAGVGDSISFFVKTSSENSFDFLRFYIDNVKQGEWSGELDWRRASYAAHSGTHNYKWMYTKDIYLDVGEDCAWVDYIEFPPPVLPQISAGPNDTICAGMVDTLTGSAALFDSLKWTTYGDGTFSNDTLVNPVYTPGGGDISNGNVRLRLTGWGVNGSTTRSMQLFIGAIPVIDEIMVWPNDTVCANHQISLSLDTVNGAHYLWIPGGFTTPAIEMDTSATGGMGTFVVKARITSRYNCSATDSTRVTFQDCTGITEPAGTSGFSVFPNPFSRKTTLSIRLLKSTATDMVIIDETGRTLKHLLHQYLSAGISTFVWDGKDDQDNRVLPGIYYVVLSSGDKKSVHKIILLP